MNVQDNHTEKPDWEQNWKSWSEQENDPCLDKHLGIIEMDVEVRTTVELHISIKSLLSCLLLQLLFWTASPLVIGLQQPFCDITIWRYQDEFKWWPDSIDYQNFDYVITNSRVPILVEIPIESLKYLLQKRDLNFHRYQHL